MLKGPERAEGKVRRPALGGDKAKRVASVNAKRRDRKVWVAGVTTGEVAGSGLARWRGEEESPQVYKLQRSSNLSRAPLLPQPRPRRLERDRTGHGGHDRPAQAHRPSHLSRHSPRNSRPHQLPANRSAAGSSGRPHTPFRQPCCHLSVKESRWSRLRVHLWSHGAHPDRRQPARFECEREADHSGSSGAEHGYRGEQGRDTGAYGLDHAGTAQAAHGGVSQTQGACWGRTAGTELTRWRLQAIVVHLPFTTTRYERSPLRARRVLLVRRGAAGHRAQGFVHRSVAAFDGFVLSALPGA